MITYKLWLHLEKHDPETEEEFEDVAEGYITLEDQGCVGFAIVEMLDMADGKAVRDHLAKLLVKGGDISGQLGG